MEKGRVSGFIRKPIDIPKTPEGQTPDWIDGFSDTILNEIIPDSLPPLRWGQVEALTETVKFFREGGRAGYIEQASGYGKSLFVQKLIIANPGRSVVYVPSRTATHNMVKKLKESGGEDFGIVDGEHKEFDHKITVVSLETVRNIFETLAKNKGNKYLTHYLQKLFSANLSIVDEVHHFLNPRALEILTAHLLHNPQSVMIGTTATEGYSETKTAEKLFGRNLHRVSLAEAEDEKVLISPRLKYLMIEASLDGLKVSPGGDYLILNEPLKQYVNTELLEAYLEARRLEGGKLRTLSYARTIEDANKFATLANSMGVKADVVTADTKNRDGIYKRLEAGELDTVVTVGTAIESLDLPWLEGTIHLTQTRSLRVARQMYPRSMRNIDGKKNPWIFVLVFRNTSFKNAPIMPHDILKVTNFVNGGVVKPRSEPLYDHRLLQLERRHPGQDLAEGLESEVSISKEIIDISSLFRMGLLDRVSLVGQGLVSKEEEENVRKLINELIYKKLNKNGSELVGTEMGAVLGFDEDEKKQIILSLVVTKLTGISSSHISGDQLAAFTRFLSGGSITDANKLLEKEVGVRQEGKFYIDPELSDLCEKYRNNDITEEEKKALAEKLTYITNTARENGIDLISGGLYFLNSFVLSSYIYSGSIGTIIRRLGMAEYFTVKSRKDFLEFVREYGGYVPDLQENGKEVGVI